MIKDSNLFSGIDSGDYSRFIKILKETKGIRNSLNEVLKYDFIYHSNKIEGSTFTTEALQLLIEKNVVKGTHTLDDIQSTINSFYTFDLVIDSLGEKITLSMIKEWHGSLIYRTSLCDIGLSGVFKKYGNMIIGADFETASPLEVEDRLNDLLNWYYSLTEINLTDVLKFHLEFERIHPFQDGNGRIGRFIFLKQLLENKLELKYMNGESLVEYKEALALSSSKDVSSLEKYVSDQKDFMVVYKSLY